MTQGAQTQGKPQAAPGGPKQGARSGKVLRRSKDDRMLFGVCGGVAQFLGVESNLVRLAVAVLAVLGGTGIWLYAIGALLLPEEGEQESIAQQLLAKGKQS